jgi:hypothetical protein
LPSRVDDPPQKVGFSDDKWFLVPGGGAAVEDAGDVIYLAIAVRNVGTGIAVLHGWYLLAERLSGTYSHAPLDEFRRSTRDLYIAPGEVGFWQGVFRDPADPGFATARAAIAEDGRLGIEVLYGDPELGQRSVTLFSVTRRDESRWIATVARQWSVDRPDPR